MTAPGEAAGISTKVLLRLTGLPPSTLQYWIKQELVKPSVLGSAGHRLERYWSTKDVVEVRTIRALRLAGYPLRQIHAVKKRLALWWSSNLSATHLVFDGTRLFAADDSRARLVDILGEGQGAFSAAVQVVALPWRTWRAQAESIAEPLNLDKMRSHRRSIQSRNRVARRRGFGAG